jgi:hypothetical protein
MVWGPVVLTGKVLSDQEQSPGGFAMIRNKKVDDRDPDWCDAVMRILPRMYRLGQVTGTDDFVFVYVTTFFSVREQLRRGATDSAVRHQMSRILRYIDGTDHSDLDKEQFASPFARAVDDALQGRPPCVLQVPQQ